MLNVIYQSSRSRVIEHNKDSYEVQAVSTRNMDGVMERGWATVCTYSTWLCIDWLGHVYTYWRPIDPKARALKEAQGYE